MRLSSRRNLIGLLAGAVAGATVRPAAAHHGWGSYDADNPVQATGTIEQASYSSPHGELQLATPDKTWEVVLAPPYRMTNRGLTPEMLAVGREVEVMGYPHRTRTVEMRAEWIRVDGKTVQLR